MNNLKEKIYEMYMYWKSKRSNYRITNEMAQKYLKLIRKKVSISEAKGAVLNQKKKEIEKLNKIQDSLLDFIENYKQLYIKGGAGTGKTWIGIKKIKRKLNEGKDFDVLFICSSETLSKYVKEILNENKANIANLNNLNNIKGKFDLVVVDEAQDFDENQAIQIRELIRDENKSELLILYDPQQNIENDEFKDYFYIDLPPFVLKRNVRNTKNIYEFAVKSTKLGEMSVPNTIEGIEPKVDKIKPEKQAINRIENIVVDLVEKEGLEINQIVLLSDKKFKNSIFNEYGLNSISKWFINHEISFDDNESLKFRTIKEFKGLESDVIIFINQNKDIKMEEKYVAFTRARYMLYVIINY